MELQLLAAMAEAVAALDRAGEDLRFADAALAVASGPVWDVSLVERYERARDAFTEAYETVEAYLAYM